MRSLTWYARYTLNPQTQAQKYMQAHRNASDCNNEIMEMLNDKHNPLTGKDLVALANKNERFERFRKLGERLIQEGK